MKRLQDSSLRDCSVSVVLAFASKTSGLAAFVKMKNAEVSSPCRLAFGSTTTVVGDASALENFLPASSVVRTVT